MKRLIVTTLVSAFVLVAPAASNADTIAGVVEGCTASTPGTTVPNPLDGTPGTTGPLTHERTCGYSATTNGGWCALAERWEIVQYNNNSPSRQVMRREAGGLSDPLGGDPECASHLATPGTYVEATVTNGFVRIGNDVPMHHPVYDTVWEQAACLLFNRC